MRFVLAFLAFVLLTEAASAQRRGAPRFAEQGDVALVIGVQGLDVLRLQPALGGIGVRYRLADRTVVGASVGIDVQFADDYSEDAQDTSEREFDRSSVVGAVWFEQHVGRPRRAVSPFVGAGVQFGVASSEATSERAVRPCPPSQDCGLLTQAVVTETDTRFVAGGLALGAEVRLVRGVTLGGAYTLGVRYTEADLENRIEQTNQETRVQAQESQGLRFGTGTSELSLSVYF